MAATTLTRNLKLRLTGDMTTDLKYNFNRLDSLASSVQVDTLNDVLVRSVNDIHLLPESNDIGGSGVGGRVLVGSVNQPVAELAVYASLFSVSSLSLRDTGGTKNLSLRYTSTLSGSADTADRVLSFDLQGGDRSLILGGDVTTAGGSLSLTLAGPTALTLPIAGTLATLTGVETLTNKTLDANSNNLLNLADDNIASGANIQGSKIAPLFATTVTAPEVKLNNGSNTTYLKAATSGQSANIGWELPPTDGTSGQILETDGAGKLRWADSASGSLSGLSDVDTTGVVAGDVLQFDGGKWVPGTAGGGTGLAVSWLPADGATKTVVHSFGTTAVTVEIFDENQQTIEVDSITRASVNSVQLVACQAPSGSWTVLVNKL